MSKSDILLEDRFKLEEIKKEEKFSKVERVVLVSDNNIKIEIDIHTDLYSMKKGNQYWVMITSSLGNFQEDKGIFVSEEFDRESIKDKFEYVMHGKIYNMNSDNKAKTVSIFASFGGLLMKVSGKDEDLKNFNVDSRIYILIRLS
ncbi:RNA polymerase rpb8 (macronuclear) [Tetrahymena thermophila SB210]|uniref:DNA-directed RNA polymerases I, II, and III subunit RPABC3 n=1 Tax=Tetrahymena thermophila (strain SB210) TaxID=312017 RepID=I7LTT4_TETTS|nr:RNA polymerase rpb8 [Tetrahymena thermophila SB210]EAR86114.1 RNA polymerase rpb8 [Tetrahymena thermophila SB210]|eukprot:XP_976709.1 RNA polymerase rpb8 [Tetrahymena thermophila SB210]